MTFIYDSTIIPKNIDQFLGCFNAIPVKLEIYNIIPKTDNHELE